MSRSEKSVRLRGLRLSQRSVQVDGDATEGAIPAGASAVPLRLELIQELQQEDGGPLAHRAKPAARDRGGVGVVGGAGRGGRKLRCMR